MPDKVSLSKKAIQLIDNFERVALRALEAAENIYIRSFLCASALWHIFHCFMGKH